MTRPAIPAVLLVALASCGEEKGGGLPLEPAEQAAFDTAARVANVVVQAASLAASFANLQSLADPARTLESITAAAARRARASLDGCGTMTTDTGTITVGLEPTTGCLLSNGIQVSGSVFVRVSVAIQASVELAFDGVVGNSIPLDGTLRLTTATAPGLDAEWRLTSSDLTLMGDLVVDSPEPTTLVFDGSQLLGEVGRDMLPLLFFEGLGYVVGDCYPSWGTLGVMAVGADWAGQLEVIYGETTRDSGQVTVRHSDPFGSVSSTSVSLPAYGACPAVGPEG